MHNYNDYTIEDLARDDYFRTSMLHPDRESTAFWQAWIAARPDYRDRYEKARIIVLALDQRYNAQLPKEEVAHRVGQIIGRLDEIGSAPATKKPFLFHYWWRVAAVFVASLGFLLWNFQDSSKPQLSQTVPEQATQVSNALVARKNDTQHSQTLILSDSSIVTLFPGSTLQFPETFAGESRKVTLSGDAFFEVSHGAKPFLVYAGETVTQVWGTRFRVTAFPKDDLVKVSVKSGKVSVHKSSEFELPASSASKPAPGIMLTMHQQAVFDRNDLLLEKSQLKDLEIIAQDTDSSEQVFVDTPVAEVFNKLENLYGIEIAFDEHTFANCRIITSFRGETLTERINSICEAIDAHYEPSNGGIVIAGSGCR
ncbi:FecR family protein [Dyadobacter sp. CY323]|uniref:FecR family protein n=1 Tax=Dyadobacter sp. CY323 TaxID=2907302 RepID=UPI001F1855F5|nr:FecR family protein [Dyadobacter sp. CY323]MCE6991802.1 FecR domain-containing protein [Dyadobacter sp. CY323]